MRILAIIAAGAIVIGTSVTVNAAPLSPAGISRTDGSSIVLVQEKKKESTTEKVKTTVKRAWKRMVGYKYNVSCLLQETRVCRETGKSEADARAKCQSQHPLCVVNEAK
jgi:hypothetical protein